MNPQEFEKFIRDDVLDNVVHASDERRLHTYMAVVRFRNGRYWRSANLSVTAVRPAGTDSPEATIEFDVDGSVLAGTGDARSTGTTIPDIAHFRVRGKYRGKAKIAGSPRRQRLLVESDPISNYRIDKTILLPEKYNDSLASALEKMLENLDDVISNKISLRGDQELG